MLETCVRNRDAPTCVRIHLWPLRRDDNSRVVIGQLECGVLIGPGGTCRLLALARAAIDST